MDTINRILMTGASGFVGSRIADAMHDKYELVTPSHHEFDITSSDNVERFIKDTRPDAILHLAAISNTGYCEEHPEESYLVNVTGVENIAGSAARHSAKLVFFSSDQVYNGNLEAGLLTEYMPVAPENHYGRHKLLAEERAIAICPDCVALRATWMYDSHRPGKNLLNTYETAREYAGFLGADADKIIIADTERFPEHVRNISISMKKAYDASNGKIRFKDTLEGLKSFHQ